MLIADSGTTKTDWCLVIDGSLSQSVRTKGMNPYFQSYEEIKQEISCALMPQIGGVSVDTVHFYGAGCLFERADTVSRAIRDTIAAQTVFVSSDLLAATHGVCRREPAIVCILGTGSNSCFFDGENIVRNVPALGYILGDEGSGSMLGRMLVSNVLKGILSEPLRKAFFKRFGLTQADIMEHVYRQPFPNYFLASFSPFLLEHIDAPEIYSMVEKCFTVFLERDVMQYDYRHYPVHFVGSIAWHYRDVLIKTVEKKGLSVGRILKSPMTGLLHYYGVETAK